MLELVFGYRVKDIRKSLNISQEDLATLTGVERSQISKIENGNANITIETIEKIAKALKVKAADLFDETHYKNLLLKDEYSVEKLHPFVKWAGGKNQIMGQIKNLLPEKFNHYFEPFVGGGALFFNLAPETAFINDTNEELVQAFECIQDVKLFNQLITKLEEHEINHTEEYFLEIRALDRDDNFINLSKVERAARMIYLNKSCFNGLYRVNSKGYFNVPSAKKEVVKTFNRESMIHVHKYLSSNEIKITSLDFNQAVKNAKQGDFVYFDPPYDSFDEQNNFTAYSKDAFGKEEQKRLFETFDNLAKKGVYVMLSNHYTNYIKDLYKDYNIHVITARRSINSNGSKRGLVEEVIITNY